MMKEAMYCKRIENNMVECYLCPHNCKIAPDKAGSCRVRKNIDGTLYSVNYGKVSSWGMDPIEKKPLYHFHPGSWIFSVGSVGCNFRCKFCQNWQIAQLTEVNTESITPEQLVAVAKSQKDNIGIAYTYNEPTIWFEYVIECAKLAHGHGLKNVLVTNGFIQKEPFEELLPYIDAMNIDVKAYTEDFYKDLTSGRLAPVKQTVEIAQKSCHVEITTLIIPQMNDSEEEIEQIARWLSSMRRDIPLHLTRYFPNYRLKLPATSEDTIRSARHIAKKHLDYVYTGNMADNQGSNTFCPKCGNPVICREGYRISKMMTDGSCDHCGQKIAIIE